ADPARRVARGAAPQRGHAGRRGRGLVPAGTGIRAGAAGRTARRAVRIGHQAAAGGGGCRVDGPAAGGGGARGPRGTDAATRREALTGRQGIATSSSSVAATTAWSAPPTSPAPD